jgi:glutamate synthase (NADPH/NADH) large chain
VKLEPQTDKQRAIDFDRILAAAAAAGPQGAGYGGIINAPHDQGRLNREILDSLAEALESGAPARRSFEVRNYDRSVGASLSGAIADRFGRDGFPGEGLKLNFTGTAGQSFGVWNTHGVHLKLMGDANDYVGKGMAGGSIAIMPHSDSTFVAQRSAIVGNTCLYGATGGAFFAAGQAGERFAVRNSGAKAVVEGVGHHGCEYMTGGQVLILGRTGSNFAAGMTGGTAWVLDLHERFRSRVNGQSVSVADIDTSENSADQQQIRELLRLHVELTGSRWGRKLLDEFEHFMFYFRVVRPQADREAMKQGGQAPRLPLKVVG